MYLKSECCSAPPWLGEPDLNRCSECKTPLKNIQTNQWMCDQSPNMCKMSTKVLFLNNPKEEEE